jgi:putative polyhydroxyalkanoate system protein
MSNIDIRRKHPHSLKRAKAAVNETAEAMREKFDIESAWSGNTLKFNRAGVEGRIKVTEDEIHVTAELGFLLGMLKPSIEREIERHLDKHFK